MRFVVLISLLIQFVRLVAQPSFADSSVVATVDSEPIILQELKLCEQKIKSEVELSYRNKFALQSDDHYTNKNSFGESIEKTIRIKAMNEAIEIKIQQLLARKMGLITDISYQAFLNELNKENLRRNEALMQHKIVYGPAQYTEDNYFNYRNSNMLLLLKHTLAKKVFQVSEENLHVCYEQTKDSLYKMPDYIKVLRLDLTRETLKPTVRLEKDIILKGIQDQLQQEVLDSTKFITLGNYKWLLRSKVLQFDPLVYQNGEGEEWAEILNQIERVKVGKYSPLFETSDGYNLYLVLDRKNCGYRPFETVRHSVENQFINSRYSEIVSELRKKSTIIQF